MFFHLRGIIKSVWCEMGTVVNRGPTTTLTSFALPAKESPQVGSFILTYLDALFLVSKMFILGTEIPLKDEMWRGEDSPDSTEPHLSTDMDGCLVFGREPVKFLSLSVRSVVVHCVSSFLAWQKAPNWEMAAHWENTRERRGMMASIRCQLVLGTSHSQDGRKI